MSLRIVSATLVLFLTGCDPFYGVESDTKLAGPVDVRCVNAALASIPEAGRVTYRRNEVPSTEIFPKRRKAHIMYVWLYGERGWDALQIYQTPDRWYYRNARSRVGVAVPHEEMARFVPLMQKVNRVIQTRCGLPVADLRAEPVGETKPGEV